MSLNSLLNGGGVISVAGTIAGNIAPDLEQDPRLHKLEEGGVIPHNCKAVLYTRFVSHGFTDFILDEARKRHLTLFPMESTGSLNSKLREIFEKPKESEEDKMAKYKSLKAFCEAKIDMSKEVGEQIDRVYEQAKEKGLTTSRNSVMQCLHVIRRDKRGTGIPKSIKSKQAILLSTLDDAIAALSLIRETVVSMESENKELKEKFDKFKELFK